MRRHILVSFLCLLYLVGVSFAGPCGRLRASWGAGGCAVAQAAEPFTGWSKHNDADYYYDCGRLVAGFRDGDYRVFRDGVWGNPVTPPWKTVTAACKCGSLCKCDPCKCSEPKPVDHVGAMLFGVDTKKLHKGADPRYSINGKPVQRHEAMAALQLADDSQRPHVTFIGQADHPLAKSFEALPEAAKARTHTYAPGTWPLQCGFVQTGQLPVVYVQNAKGEVLYRKANPTVEELAQEVRKAQPDYDPSKDPSGQVDPLIAVKQFFASVPAYVWGIGGAVLALLVLRRNQ